MDGVGCSGEGCNCKAKAPPEHTRVPELLAQARMSTEVSVAELFIKNSSKLTDADREVITQSVLSAAEEKVVITHGTQTMCETARFLGTRMRPSTKVVVLTGAMKSTLEEGSDGLFNLGFALGAVRHLTPGVYVAMHGRIFPWNNVQLASQPKRFEEM